MHLCPVPWLVLPRSAVHICLSARLLVHKELHLLVLPSAPLAADAPGCGVLGTRELKKANIDLSSARCQYVISIKHAKK